MLLVDALEKHGENWDEIVKVFNGTRNKQDCLLHLIQLPIKDNIIFKLGEGISKPTDRQKDDNILNAITDQNNPIISQVVFFAKMFDKFVQEDIKSKQEGISETNPQRDFSSASELKEIIYKTYSKSIDNSKELRMKEKHKMEKIMNLLVYLQMKKIEMKLSYFNDFEKLIQFETQQMKSMESQIIQDRIKLAIKKNELIGIAEKMKKEAREINLSGGAMNNNNPSTNSVNVNAEKNSNSENNIHDNENTGNTNQKPTSNQHETSNGNDQIKNVISTISFKGPVLDNEPRVLPLDP
jgi:hypothetical protein